MRRLLLAGLLLVTFITLSYSNCSAEELKEEFNPHTNELDWVRGDDMEISSLTVTGDIQVSGDVSANGDMTANAFFGDGRNLTNITAVATAGGNDTELQFNDSTALGGITELTYSGTTVYYNGVELNSGTAPSGTTGYIPYWSGTTTFSESNIYNTGANVGIGTASPQRTLDVNGSVIIRGGLEALSGITNLTIGNNLTVTDTTYVADVISTGNATFNTYFGDISNATNYIGGSDTHVQFNDSSIMGGDAGFTYNKTTDSVTILGDLTANGDLTAREVYLNDFDGAGEGIAHILNDSLNCGILHEITITDEGGINISWTVGSIWDCVAEATVATDAAGSTGCTDDFINYLYWDRSGAGTTLTLSTTIWDSSDNDVPVGIIVCQNGDIYDYHTKSIMKERIYDLDHAFRAIIKVIVTDGLVISEDADATHAFDVEITAGTFFHFGTSSSTLAANFDTMTTPMTRWFHDSSDWASDSNISVSLTQYDNLTDLTAVTSNYYYKSLFLYSENMIHWIYPQAGFVTLAQAIESPLPTIPDVGTYFPKSVSVVLKGNDIAFPTAGGERWNDERPLIGVAGTGSIGEHGILVGLDDDDHTQYSLVNGTRAYTGTVTVAGNVNASGNLSCNGFLQQDTEFIDLPLDYDLSLSSGADGGDYLFETEAPFDLYLKSVRISSHLTPSGTLTVEVLENAAAVTGSDPTCSSASKIGAFQAVGQLIEEKNLIVMKLTGATVATDLSNTGAIRLKYERRSE